MNAKYGKNVDKYGPGVVIELTGDEVALAIDTYLMAHEVHYTGPRTVTVNGELCQKGRIFVDPTGSVMFKGERFSGRGPEDPDAT